MPRRVFWIGLMIIVMIAAVPRVISYDFSLPYADHVDEPNFYLAGLEWRGLYQNPRPFISSYPPGYIVFSTVIQAIIAPLGVNSLGQTLFVMRAISAVVNVLTLIWAALAARLIVGKRTAAGTIAGWTAGAAWGLAPLVLENGVYALADPFVYAFSALAIWLALSALLEPRRRWWCVVSFGIGVLAFLFKYPAFPLCFPGALVALWVLTKDRRAGMIYLGLQIAITVIAFVLLFGLYGYSLSNNIGSLERAGRATTDAPVTERIFGNFYYALYPLNYIAWWVYALLGIGALFFLMRQRQNRIQFGALLITIFVLLTLVIAAAVLAHLTDFAPVQADYRMRDVLPATAAACILLGVMVGQIAALMPPKYARLQPLIQLPLVVLVWLPQWDTDMRMAAERDRPDVRVTIHRWYDQNLEPGKVLVYEENDKTFNPFYGGMHLSGGKWVDWLRVEDIRENTAEAWREAGLVYALIPRWQWDDMQQTEAGRAYFADMLYLRTFGDATMRGPQTVVLRFTRPQHETTIQFGEAITLLGYDRSAAFEEGSSVDLRFYWRAAQLPATNYNLFIHLVNAETGELIAQADGTPAARPTLTWDAADETLISPWFILTIPDDLAAGDYHILLGLYDYTLGPRLPVTSEQLPITPTGDALILGAFSVPRE